MLGVLVFVGFVVVIFFGLLTLGSEVLAFCREILFILFLRLGGFAFGLGLDFLFVLVGEVEVGFVALAEVSLAQIFAGLADLAREGDAVGLRGVTECLPQDDAEPGCRLAERETS